MDHICCIRLLHESHFVMILLHLLIAITHSYQVTTVFSLPFAAIFTYCKPHLFDWTEKVYDVTGKIHTETLSL